jgi:hypothetical protein
MVRAVLNGTKTQTRRVVKPSPSQYFLPDGPARNYSRTLVDVKTGEQYPDPVVRFGVSDENEDYPCPYGQPGDRLWVRETWASFGSSRSITPTVQLSCQIRYHADNACQWRAVQDGARGVFHHASYQLRPSIHMPRWACRIELEITEVRVERLNAITEEDAIAEGIEQRESCAWKNYRFKTVHPKRGKAINDEENRIAGYVDPRQSYRSLWEAITGVDSWALNPWVWVVTFKKVEASK